eukprot:gnl/TRDRNA2_/TRDRNA2_143527_c0_seq2.p1 gnl/TRDRNA2_/TRDRNA2_143527_c0~~gnl/TRDRNA2_/TRDRNA2_143527_c0_seq2.p1  ORF type:complete len:315 (+),score=9.98 gnl/TRDRNA2_/TRDRNA2_143527_c0_seq2:147-1091(+)
MMHFGRLLPLLMRAPCWPLDAPRLEGASQCPRGTIFAVYHKTGYVFSWKLLWHLSSGDVGDVPYFHHISDLKIFAPGTSQGSDGFHWWQNLPRQDEAHMGQVHQVVEPHHLWSKPEGMCLIHWFRSPSSLLISAYNYHRRSPHVKEEWLSTVGQCSFCGSAQWSLIFSQCSHQCTYRELLRRLPFWKGLLTEYWRAEVSIAHMLKNLDRWRYAPDVLHLSVDSLRSDYNATMSCMFRFLGYRPENLLKRIQQLNLGDNPSNRDRHTTHSRYGNSSEVPKWLKDNMLNIHGDFDFLIDDVTKRQASRHGCPPLNA